MLAITSANATTSATIIWALTSAKGIRCAYMYGNNTNHTQILKILWKNIFPHTSFGVQNYWDNIFFRLRKPCWMTGESLSPKFKKCPVLEKNHIYIIPNRMRSLHSYIAVFPFICYVFGWMWGWMSLNMV